MVDYVLWLFVRVSGHCSWPGSPRGEEQRVIIIARIWPLLTSSCVISQVLASSSLTWVMTIAFSAPISLFSRQQPEGSFKMYHIVPSFAQNLPVSSHVIQSKSQSPQSGLQGPISPPDPSGQLSLDSLHMCLPCLFSRCPSLRAFAGMLLLPRSLPPINLQGFSFSFRPLLGGHFVMRPSRTTCFLSPASSFSPWPLYTDTILFIVYLPTIEYEFQEGRDFLLL